jgi:predicted small metal-binding protein
LAKSSKLAISCSSLPISCGFITHLNTINSIHNSLQKIYRKSNGCVTRGIKALSWSFHGR